MFSSIDIQNFRGSSHWGFSFGKNTSIIGPNGSGKSHILEAIHLLAGGKMLYHATELNNNCTIEGSFSEDGLKKSYILHKTDGKEQYSVQGKKTTKKNFFQEIPFSTVYIGPFEMNLLYFAPNIRREYIDSILERAFEQFGKVKKDYEAVVKQRNALLKKIREQQALKNDLGFWDKKHAELSELYVLYRRKYITFIQEHLGNIGNHGDIGCIYETSIPEYDGEIFICNYLQENRERDILSGHTHIGPHRDDFFFEIEENDETQRADQFLSRGEMKLLLLELKKIEILFLEKYRAKKILLLIDDIFAELDNMNTIKVLGQLQTYQTIVTSQRNLPEDPSLSGFENIYLGEI